jgi:hypothetical protein
MIVTIYTYDPVTGELRSVETCEPPVPKPGGLFRSQHDEICGCKGSLPFTNHPEEDNS